MVQQIDDPAPEAKSAESGVDAAPAPAPTTTDRRRPGRLEQASPALISLLRKPARRVATVHEEPPNRLVRGTINALLISAVIWALIGVAVWWLIF
jgi:hypothetical protein